eukprot:7643007-Lingulodinium_polyedra.AAC.1
MYGGGLFGWIDERIGQLTERYVSDLDEAEAKQVPRVCREIQERAEDEWVNAKTGRPCTTDKP